MSYTGGQKVRQGDLLPGNIIARGSRATSSTAASAAQGVLRLDGVVLTAGRRYLVRTNSLILNSTVAADRATVRLSMATGGAAATTASTAYGISNGPNIDSTVDGVECNPSFSYTPSSDDTVSILLWTLRRSGTGNITLVASGGATIDIEVFDCGVDPGDTGTDI